MLELEHGVAKEKHNFHPFLYQLRAAMDNRPNHIPFERFQKKTKGNMSLAIYPMPSMYGILCTYIYLHLVDFHAKSR